MGVQTCEKPNKGFLILGMEDFILPPHVENRNGCYFNTVNNRWVGNYKIKEVCDKYWDEMANSPVVDFGDGILHYKTNFVEPDLKKQSKAKKAVRLKKWVDKIKENKIQEESDNLDIIDISENKFLDKPKDEIKTTLGKIEEPSVVIEPILRTIRKKRKPRTKTIYAPCTPAKFDQYLEDLSIEICADLNCEKVDDVILIQEKEEPVQVGSTQLDIIDISVEEFIYNNSTFSKSDYHEEDCLIDIIGKNLKGYEVDFQTIYDSVVKEKHELYGMYYEEFMAVVVASVYLNCPFADRIDFVSSLVNRDCDQIRALLGIHNILYNFMDDDSSHYNDVFWSLNFDICRHFARYYPINYHYNYRNPNREDWI